MSLDKSTTDSAEIVKNGTGRLMVHSDGALGVDLHVAEGTLGFARFGTACPWLRFTFKRMWNNYVFDLSEMLLMNASGGRVDGGGKVVYISSGVGAGTEGSDVANVAANCAPKDMPPQSIWASDQSWNLAEPSGGYRERSPSALFDGVAWSKLRYNNTAPARSNPSSWKTFVVRLPATTAETYCYNFRNGYSNTGHPSDWLVEASADGLAWTTVDEQADQQPGAGTQQFYNGGLHYRLLGRLPGAAGLSAGATVRVDRGAVFDASGVAGGQTLDSITVDCAPGTGEATVKNVRLAATGMVNLLNYARQSEVVLPWSFVDSETGNSLDGWQVCVNGVADPKRRIAWRDGKLVVAGPGLLMMLK